MSTSGQQQQQVAPYKQNNGQESRSYHKEVWTRGSDGQMQHWVEESPEQITDIKPVDPVEGVEDDEEDGQQKEKQMKTFEPSLEPNEGFKENGGLISIEYVNPDGSSFSLVNNQWQFHHGNADVYFNPFYYANGGDADD